MKISLGWVIIDNANQIAESGVWVGGTRRKLYKFKKTAENNCKSGQCAREAFAEL